MRIAEYFKVSFKKPELDDSISGMIEKKNKLKILVEDCYSRLESVETCNSNGKHKDAVILSEYLLIDLINLSLAFENKSPILKNDNWIENTKKISYEKIVSGFEKIFTISETSFESEEEKSEKLEISLSDQLELINLNIFKINKNQFENPVDNFKKRIIFQIGITSLFLVLIVNAGTKKYNQIKPIKKDTARVYFMNEKNPVATNSNFIDSEIVPSQNWQDLSFLLPSNSDVNQIKFEPVHQIHARMQIKEVKLLDSNKKILRSISFKLSKSGLMENIDKNELCCMEGIKPGRMFPEKFVELESTDNHPSFVIKIEDTKDVKEIALSFRYIKNKERFAE